LHSSNLTRAAKSWGRQRRTGENREQEGYGRQDRKDQKARVLRGQEVGEKCKMLIFVVY